MLAPQNELLLSISERGQRICSATPADSGNSCLVVGEQTIVCEASLGLGHKIAARDIASGEKIIKYGAPIGSAIRDIRMGEHVHLHNIQSDYIPTYTLGSETD